MASPLQQVSSLVNERHDGPEQQGDDQAHEHREVLVRLASCAMARSTSGTKTVHRGGLCGRRREAQAGL